VAGPAARSFPLRESVVMLIVFICILVFCILLPRAASADSLAEIP